MRVTERRKENPLFSGELLGLEPYLTLSGFIKVVDLWVESEDLRCKEAFVLRSLEDPLEALK